MPLTIRGRIDARETGKVAGRGKLLAFVVEEWWVSAQQVVHS
jgi:hypothetical protein